MRIRIVKFGVLLPLLLAASSNLHSQSPLNWEPTNGPLMQYTVTVERIVEDQKGNIFEATFGDGLWRSTDQGRTWKPFVKGVKNGFVDGVDIDSSNRLYISSRPLMAYSDDEGMTWTTIPNPPSIDSASAEFVLASSGSGLLFCAGGSYHPEQISTDLGKTWRVVPPMTPGGDSTESTWWGDTISRSNGIPLYLSGDLGNSWVKKIIDSSYPNATCELVSRINDTDVYAVLYGVGCYLSHDCGSHFFPIAAPGGGGYTFFFAGPGAGTYIAGGNGEDTVLISHDDCQHWISIPSLLPYPTEHRCELYSREGTILFGGDDGNIVSYDSSKTWTTSNTIFSFSNNFIVHGQELWTSYDSTLQVTTDLGNTWQNIATPVTVGQFFFTSSGAIIINGWYADQYASTDSGKTWQDILQTQTAEPWSGLTVVGDTILVALDTTLLISPSLGDQWDTLIFPDSLYHHATENLLITPTGTLWVFVDDDSMCISTDLGETYGPLDACVPAEEYWFDSVGNVYFFQNSSIYCSSNNGNTLYTIPVPPSSTNEGSLMDIWSDSTGLFVSYSDSGIYRTTNNGVTWTNDNLGIGDRIAGHLASLDGYLFLTTDGGVYREADTNSTSGSFALSYPVSIARPGPVYWISVAPQPVIKTSFAAYPNPFTQSTQISFTSESAGYADISIVNLLGEQVARIFSGELVAGEHSFTFSNTTDLPDGMYECLVRMNGRIETLPMVQAH